MDKLKAHYGISLRRRLEVLEALLPGVDGPDADPEMERQARDLAHTLKGSGATYGFAELSRIAAETEKAEEGDLRLALSCLIETVRRVIQQCPPPDILQEQGGAS